MSYSYFLLIAASLILLILTLAKQIFYLRGTLHRKDNQLMQFYLDSKFLNSNLLNSLNIHDQGTFCSRLITKIKEYYHLDDLIIIDAVYMLNLNEIKSKIRSEVIQYIKENEQYISSQLKEDSFARFMIVIDETSWEIYVSRLNTGLEGQGMIVCVEKRPILLSKQELDSLQTSINLLKNRLIYG